MRIACRARGDREQVSICRQRIIHDPVDGDRRAERNSSRRELRLSHIGFVLLSCSMQCIDTGNRFQADSVFGPAPGFDQVRGYTTETIPRTLRFAAITIEDSNCENISCWLPKNQSVCTDTEVAVAKSPCQFG